MKEKKGPQFLRFVIPLVEVLRDLGGSGTAAEVTDLVIEKMKIPEQELEETTSIGQSRIRNQIAWARMYLVNADFIDSSERGKWKLTDKGFSLRLDKEQVHKMFKDVQALFRCNKPEGANVISPAKQDDFEVAVPYEEHKSQLIMLMQSMSPSGFEKIVRRLLSELGLRQVEVTGKTGDRGIDGVGLLEVNELVKFKVFFQCKRYDGPVSPSHLRDFRGALSGRADKGILLTTGYFTTEAKKEATREGVTPIELVDGDRLVELFEKYKLGLIPKMVYEVDREFFKNFE